MTHSPNPDRNYIAPDRSNFSFMLVRNVGHIMTNPADVIGMAMKLPENIRCNV